MHDIVIRCMTWDCWEIAHNSHKTAGLEVLLCDKHYKNDLLTEAKYIFKKAFDNAEVSFGSNWFVNNWGDIEGLMYTHKRYLNSIDTKRLNKIIEVLRND